jgi:hypothetical protein
MAVLSMSKQEFTRLDVYRRNSVAPMRLRVRRGWVKGRDCLEAFRSRGDGCV